MHSGDELLTFTRSMDSKVNVTDNILKQEIRAMERVDYLPNVVAFHTPLSKYWFKVIQGQRSWCQSKAHGRFPI